MDIKSFVANALLQISEGIQEARQAGPGARCRPVPGAGASGLSAQGENQNMFTVSFDIAVAITRPDSDPATEQLGVIAAGEGFGADRPNAYPALSRISFTVPVYWPEERPRTTDDRVKRNGTAIPDLDISL